MTKAHLLYVEDDETLSFVTKDNLELNGYKITHISNGEEALKAIKEQPFDLCILDIMLPGVDGFQIAKELRKFDLQTPLLFLTAKSLKEDRLHGLRMGADDYIVKPFSIEELILKIEVFLKRRAINHQHQPSSYSIGRLEFDYANLTLSTPDEKKQKLTKREGELLQFLLENKNHLVERSIILEKIWGKDDYFLGRSLDVFVSRLRKYLKSDPNIKIENVHGVGFRLTV